MTIVRASTTQLLDFIDKHFFTGYALKGSKYYK
jgi:hypothetical protein